MLRQVHMGSVLTSRCPPTVVVPYTENKTKQNKKVSTRERLNRFFSWLKTERERSMHFLTYTFGSL